MNTAKKILDNLIEEISEDELYEVIDFIGYLKHKRDNEVFRDLSDASDSSMQFWDNDKDDQVWNNV